MANLTAAAYYGGIPANNSNLEKPLILDNFLQGVRNSGDTAVDHRAMSITNCDVAFIQGFVHEHGKTAPHLMLRRAVIEHQKKIGKRSLIVDSNLFLYADPGNSKRYLRYSFDGVFPTTGFYFDTEIDPKRWQKISKALDIQLKSIRNSGDYILICCQRNGGWSMKGLPVQQWLEETIVKIQKFTDRPIVVRPHPGDKKWRTYLKIKGKNVSLSTKHLTEDLRGAWATVLHNSSPAVASAIEGVPVFLTDSNPEFSQAAEVSNTNLNRLENPKMFDREAWIEKLSMCHWNFEELRSGEAWQFFRKFI